MENSNCSVREMWNKCMEWIEKICLKELQGYGTALKLCWVGMANPRKINASYFYFCFASFISFFSPILLLCIILTIPYWTLVLF